MVRSACSPVRSLLLLASLLALLSACEGSTGSTTPPKSDAVVDVDAAGSDVSADSFGSDKDTANADSLVQDAADAQTDAAVAQTDVNQPDTQPDTQPDAATDSDSAANVAPSVSVTSPAVGQVFSVGQPVQIALEIVDPDDSSFDLTVTPVGASAPIYTEQAIGKTPTWTLTPTLPGALALEIAVRDDSGAEGKTTYTLLVNTAPGAPVVALQPQLPTVADAITAVIVVPATDPDPGAGQLTYTYEWFVAGLPVDTTGSTLPAGLAVKGQLVEVKVRAKDGLDTGIPGAAQTVIANSAPVPPSFGVIPAEPVMATTAKLTCAVLSPATDLDLADSVTCTTAWLVDGAVDPSATTDEIALAALRDKDGKQVAPGSQIHCQLTCTDGQAQTLATSVTAVVSEGDVCASGWNSCSPNATCTGNGSFAPDCTCKAGFTGDGKACADIDECTELLFSCDANASCGNTEGSYTCTCNAGYEGNGTSCSDIDECTTGPFPCAADGGVCANSDGSYSCTCAAGYVGDGTSCTDLNECAAPVSGVVLAMSPTADVAWDLQNSDDAVGWKWSSWQGEAGPVDVLRYGNPETNTYANGLTNGGVALSAPVTLTEALVAQPLAVRVRVLIDAESSAQFDRLHLLAVLDGQPWLLLHKGPYGMTASKVEPSDNPSGPGFPYPLAADATRVTTDGVFHDYLIQLPALASETTLQFRWEFDTVDSESNSGLGVLVAGMQLTTLPGGCGNHASCINLPGAATCACDDTAVGDGYVCLDADECATDNGGCGAPLHWECVNLPFSAATCTDNNECAPDEDAGEQSPCDPVANCENTWGGFICTCPPEGYEGDGLTCIDINECETLELPGCVTNAVCVNQPGSYTCSCDTGWQGDGFALCENRNECLEPSEEPLMDLLPLPEGATWTITASNDGVRWRIGDDGSLRYSDAEQNDFEADSGASSGSISRVLYLNDDAGQFSTALLRVGGLFDTESGTSYDQFTITVQSGKSTFQFRKGEDFDASQQYQRLLLPVELIGSTLIVTLTFDTVDDIANDGKGIWIDELELAVEFNGPCSWRAECEDLVGGYSCGACPTGFDGDGTTCTDINECDLGQLDCSEPNSQCYNVPGDAYCACKPGYGQTEGGCEDINECEDGNNGGCGEYGFATCENQIGAPPICADVAECEIENGGCGDPSYVACEEQYGAWPKCVDVDECATDNGGCGPLVTHACTNNYGEGPSCNPRNECEHSTSVLDGGYEYVNSLEEPGWRPLSSGGFAYGYPDGGYASEGSNNGTLYLFEQSVPAAVQQGPVYLLMDMDLDIDFAAGDGLWLNVYLGKGESVNLPLGYLDAGDKTFVAADVSAFAGQNINLQLTFDTVTDASTRTGQGIVLRSARLTAIVDGNALGWCGTRGICEDTPEGFSCSCAQGFVWNGERCVPMAVE